MQHTAHFPLTLHLIPYDGIGGVEIATRSLPVGDHSDLRFGRVYLSAKAGAHPPDPDIWTGPSPSEWALANYANALCRVLRLSSATGSRWARAIRRTGRTKAALQGRLHGAIS